MAKNKAEKVPTFAPAVKFSYLCPACSDVAIDTSNKMLGVSVNCKKCGKLIELNDVERYKKV